VHRRRFLTSAVSAGLLVSKAYAADSWPSRRIRLVVPGAAGGFADITARLVSESLAQKLGQPVFVEDIASSAGIQACQNVARSAPDGYNLIVGTINTHATNVSFYKSLPYDPVKDFKAISRVGGSPLVLVVSPSLDVKTIGDLIDLAKQKSTSLTFGSAGIGTSSHIAGELFKQLANIDLLHVPFRGTAPAVAAVLGSQIDILFDTLPSAMPNVQSNLLRGLGVSIANRVPSLPDVPTIAEVLPGFEISVWCGLFGPSALANEVTERLDTEMRDLLATPQFRDRIIAAGITPMPAGPEEFLEFTKFEISKWRDVAQKAGIVPE
jgi:tripartite-type tricarboxylate transporter receptor subunit TctC